MFTEDIKEIQAVGGLAVDGFMGPKTWDWVCQAVIPSAPSFSPLSEARKKELFGDPTGGRADPFEDDGTFSVAKEFRAELVRVDVPEWFCVRGFVTVHALASDSLRSLVKHWSKAGVDKYCLTFNGSVSFRKVRSGESLSSHAFGTAFDTNAAQNPLGKRPAMPWEKGCVLEMVKIANGEGWFWGGHFSRLDAMHWELAEV